MAASDAEDRRWFRRTRGCEPRSSEVEATPYFFLGVTEPNGQYVRVVQPVRGPQDFATFQKLIERLLLLWNK